MKIDRTELSMIIKDLGEYCSFHDVNEIFLQCDTDNSGFLEFDEFVELMLMFVKQNSQRELLGSRKSSVSSAIGQLLDDPTASDSEEEDAEMPEDLTEL